MIFRSWSSCKYVYLLIWLGAFGRRWIKYVRYSLTFDQRCKYRASGAFLQKLHAFMHFFLCICTSEKFLLLKILMTRLKRLSVSKAAQWMTNFTELTTFWTQIDDWYLMTLEYWLPWAASKVTTLASRAVTVSGKSCKLAIVTPKSVTCVSKSVIFRSYNKG